jgi:hypothetical protein
MVMMKLLPTSALPRVKSLLAAGIAGLALGGASSAQNSADEGGSMVHGVNFQMKTVLDESLCVENNAAVSSVPQLYLARCTGRPNQRWAFTDGADGSNVVVSNLGLCWTAGRRSQQDMLRIETCDYHSEQRFIITPAGLIRRKVSDDCLTVDSPAVVGSPVLVVDCSNPAVRGQFWRLVL